MNGVISSVLITIACVFAIPAIVIGTVRHNQRRHLNDPTVEAPSAVQPGGVLFVVRNRRWQSILIRSVGIVTLAVGLLLTLSAVATAADTSGGMLIAGVFFALGGAAFVFLAHTMTRSRIEAFDDHLVIHPGVGQPRPVALTELASLAPLSGNTYGGVVAKNTRKKRLVAANKLALGYDQLIDYLRARRPDLPIPDASWPVV